MGIWFSLYRKLFTSDHLSSRLPAIYRLQGLRPGGSSLCQPLFVKVAVN